MDGRAEVMLPHRPRPVRGHAQHPPARDITEKPAPRPIGHGRLEEGVERQARTRHRRPARGRAAQVQPAGSVVRQPRLHPHPATRKRGGARSRPPASPASARTSAVCAPGPGAGPAGRADPPDMVNGTPGQPRLPRTGRREEAARAHLRSATASASVTTRSTGRSAAARRATHASAPARREGGGG